MPRQSITCPICGNAFTPRYQTQKYCSNPCRYAGKRKAPDATCIQCGTKFVSRTDGSGKFCSRACASAHRRYPERLATCALCGEEFTFRGYDVTRGRKYCSLHCANADAVGRISHQGYVAIREGGRYVKEHRLVMERILGRELRSNEVVHHINGIRHDNRPENLQVMTQAEHIRLHMNQHHHGRKLSDEDVREIRRLYIPRHPLFNQDRLAKRFGVTRQTIGDIVTGRRRSG